MIIEFTVPETVGEEKVFLEVYDAAKFVTDMYSQDLEGRYRFTTLILLTEPPQDGVNAFGRAIRISGIDGIKAVEDGKRLDEEQVFQGHSFA